MNNNNNLRALLYTTVAGLAATSSWLVDAPDDPNWKQWATLAVGSLVAGLTSLRAYLDGSAERSRQAVGIQHGSGLVPLLLALALPAFLLTAVTGCKTAYPAAASTAITAEKAMESWASYFDSAAADTVRYGTDLETLWEQRETVDNAWETYRAAMNLADDARQAYMAGVGSDGATLAALKAARDNAAALVDLVNKFLSPPQP